MGFFTIYFFYVVLAAILDIIANLAIVKSQGFQKKSWGALGIILAWGAFLLLAQAVKGMELAIAYTTWGIIGILGTAVCARIWFNQRLKPIGWIGIFVVILAIFILKTA